MNFPAIQNNDGKQAVSARDLHSFLESKQDFSHWIKNRITKYGLIENQDFIRFDKIIETTGGRNIEYVLTLDAAKELSMVEGNAKGKQARQYFIEVEKQARAVAKPLSTLDMLEMSIKQLREQESRVQAIEAEQTSIRTEVAQIKAASQTRPDYFTIVGYATLNKVQVGLQMAAKLGSKASRICKEKGYQMEEIPDPRFGRVRMYPKMVLETVFNEPI